MGSQPPSGSCDLETLKRQSLFDAAQATNVVGFDLLKWTLGSLLVVNGGALVALLGANELRTEAFKEAAFFFGGGMLAALVGGVCFTAGLGLHAVDGMKRAWDPQPLVVDDIANWKPPKATQWWIGVGSVLWLGSLALFAFGCVSMAFVPRWAELEKLSAESREATARFTAETALFLEISRSRNSTPEQRQAALIRVRAAQIEAKIRSARVTRALGEQDDLLQVGDNLLDQARNLSTNAQ